MAKKQPKRSEAVRLKHLAHDVLILHMFNLFEQIEGKKFTKSELRRLMENVWDPRVINSAMKGHGIHETSAQDIAHGLSKKMEEIIEEIGGVEQFAEKLRISMELSSIAKSFQWLEDRITGKPPYILAGDIVINWNNRHLVEDYRVALAVGPCPRGEVTIEYPDRGILFPYRTLGLVKYAMNFSKNNRDHQLDFALRYSTTNGKLALIEPEEGELTEPALYRRHRETALYMPVPWISDVQRLSTFVYGGYDIGEERAHFSFMQNALYRRVSFTLDLSAYPGGAIVGEPRLFVLFKLAGKPFNCCELAAIGEGQSIKPEETIGQRRTWRFESFDQHMIGVHWTIDYNRIPGDIETSREQLLGLLPDA